MADRPLRALSFRAAGPADAAGIAAIYARFVRDTVVSFEAEPPDTAEMAGRIARNAPYPWLVAQTADGTLAGFAYAGAFRARAAYRFAAETTVYVDPRAQGSGVGQQLLVALLDKLRAQGITQAIAIIALPNPTSVALHERLGYRLVGINRAVGFKQDRWWDVGTWQRGLINAVPEATK